MSLGLSKLNLNDEDMVLLGDALSKVDRVVTSIDVTENNITSLGAAALFRAFGPKSGISDLNLSGNDISTAPIDLLKMMNARPPKLTSLDVSKNPLGDDTIKLLCKGIQVNPNPNLTLLDLTKINLGDSGAIALAEMMAYNTTIIDLRVSENDITSVGVKAFGKALETNKTLQSLYMNRLHCGPDGFQSIAHAVKSKTCGLKYLDASACLLGDEGASVLLDCVNENDVEGFTVDLIDNGIRGGPEFTKLVCSKIRSGEIKSLDMS
ncbi:RNA-DNA hybrid ribonuclease, partial [Rhizoclosmatium hyalinum]